MNNKKKIIVYIIITICLICFITSLINILNWNKDRKNTNNQIENINNKTEIQEIKDSENTEIIETEKEINKSNPYWDYIKMSLINVNFNELKNINSEIIGWIQLNGSNINYPFVQTKDNDFYLNHSIDKSYNNAGWVFMDYRNSISDFNRNTIIYAHGRTDKTMFGSLRNTLNNSWYNNKDNHVIKLSTEYENTLWQIFSVYRIPTTSDYLKINFTNDDSFLEFGNMLIKRSKYNFNVNIEKNDKILTLSTCYNDKDKIVVHAKLIKRETRTN